MPPYSIMQKIRTVLVEDSITHYDEIIEKIIIYPQVDDIEVILSRQFKNGKDEVIKNESSVETVKLKFKTVEFEKQIIELIKNKKAIK